MQFLKSFLKKFQENVMNLDLDFSLNAGTRTNICTFFHILSPIVKCPKTFGMIWPSKHQIVINYRFVSRVSEEDSTFLSNLLAMKINSRILGILTRKVHFFVFSEVNEMNEQQQPTISQNRAECYEVSFIYHTEIWQTLLSQSNGHTGNCRLC